MYVADGDIELIANQGTYYLTDHLTQVTVRFSMDDRDYILEESDTIINILIHHETLYTLIRDLRGETVYLTPTEFEYLQAYFR